MELGGLFDDGLFEESRDRKARCSLSSYNAKICEPKWFIEDIKFEDLLVRMQLHKHRSDWAYRCKDYHTALHNYKAAIALLPPNNITMLRDMLESVTRCYLGLDQPDEAPISLRQLEVLMLSYDQKTNYLRLAALVYRALGRTTDELLTLQKTLWLHPMLCDVWACLARVYLEQLRQPAPPVPEDTPTPPGTATGGHCGAPPTPRPPSEALNSLTLCGGVGDSGQVITAEKRRAACTCLLRARALAGCVRKQPEFVTGCYQHMYQTVSKHIQHLGIEDDVITACLPHVTLDLQGDADMSRPSEGRSEADLVAEIEDPDFQSKFEAQWFSWR